PRNGPTSRSQFWRSDARRRAVLMGPRKRRSHDPGRRSGRPLRAGSGRGARVLRGEARVPRPHGRAERRLSLAHGAAPGAALVPARSVHAGAADARRGDRGDVARRRGQGRHAPARAGSRRLPRRLRAVPGERRGVHPGARGPLRHRGRGLPRPVGQRLEDDRGAQEVQLNWSSWIRQIHRWVSIVFVATVIANFVALARGGGAMPPPWITYSPLPPLAFLVFTG